MLKMFLLVIVAVILTLANAAPTTSSQIAAEVISQQELQEIFKEANSGDSDEQAKGIKRAGEILTKTNPWDTFLQNVQMFSSNDFLKTLVACLENNTVNVEARRSAAIALTNIATVGQNRAVYEAGALPVFIKLLKSEDVEKDNHLCKFAIGGLRSLCFLDDEYSVNVRAIVNAEAVPRLLEILGSTQDGVVWQRTVDIFGRLIEKLQKPYFDIYLFDLKKKGIMVDNGAIDNYSIMLPKLNEQIDQELLVTKEKLFEYYESNSVIEKNNIECHHGEIQKIKKKKHVLWMLEQFLNSLTNNNKETIVTSVISDESSDMN